MNELLKKSYLTDIVFALEQLYRCDRNIMTEHTCELTLSHRLGHYLANILENGYPGMYVDCEYQRDINRSNGLKRLKNVKGAYQRPDIIYHDRGKTHDECNAFVIELKWGDDIEIDQIKVCEFIKQYRYIEGYCIYNLRTDSLSVVHYSRNTIDIGGTILHYRYDALKEKLFPTGEMRDEMSCL